MSVKIRTTFYVYNNGKEVGNANGTCYVNSASEVLQKARNFVETYHPEAQDVSIIRDDNYFSNVGVRMVVARSDIDADMAFLLIINKLQ